MKVSHIFGPPASIQKAITIPDSQLGQLSIYSFGCFGNSTGKVNELNTIPKLILQVAKNQS